MVYVSIKSFSFTTLSNKYYGIQIVDVSDQVLYAKASGEKKLLSLINATVSHEMRTPINSLNSQNIRVANIAEKMEKLLDQQQSKDNLVKLRHQTNNLKKSSDILTRSTKFLIFVVNDMLDLS